MQLVQEYQANTTSFVELIKSTPDELFNSKPDGETWSIAENLEHIIRSEFGIVKLFNGPTKQTEHDINANIQRIEKRFLNRTNKTKAPKIVSPKQGDKNKTTLLEQFSTQRKQATELLANQNSDETCTLYENPIYGFVSRKEWIHFNIYHTQRHTLQIQELITHLTE